MFRREPDRRHPKTFWRFWRPSKHSEILEKVFIKIPPFNASVKSNSTQPQLDLTHAESWTEFSVYLQSLTYGLGGGGRVNEDNKISLFFLFYCIVFLLERGTLSEVKFRRTAVMDKSQEILVRFARANYSDGKKCRRPVMCISGVTSPVLKKMTEVTTHIWFREAFTGDWKWDHALQTCSRLLMLCAYTTVLADSVWER